MLQVPTFLRRRAWLTGLLAIACLIAGLHLTSSVPSAWAQAPKADEVAEDAKPADGAKAEGEKKESEAAEPEEESAFWWLIKTSGAIGALLLVLSIYFVATTVRLFFEFRQDVAAPPEIVEKCEEFVKARDYQSMYRLVKEDTSMYSLLIAAGITELPQGLAEARDAMDRTNETLVVEMEKKISMLAVLGSLGPMIGLLGTLKGMIASFSVIARPGSVIKPEEVALGISEALLLTMEGVGLSVPAIFFFAFFRNRLMTISSNTALMADEFIRRMHTSARSGRPAAAPAPAAPPS